MLLTLLSLFWLPFPLSFPPLPFFPLLLPHLPPTFPPHRAAWIALGDLSKAEAMEAFRTILEERCPNFGPWLQARLREKAERERQERERLAREKRERERRQLEEMERQRQEKLRLEQEAQRQQEERQRQQQMALQQQQQQQMAAGTDAAPQTDADALAFDLRTAGRLPRSRLTDPKFIEAFQNALRGSPESYAVVGSGESLTVRVPMPSQRRTQILWQFNTEARDIAFGVDFERKLADGSEEVTTILPSTRVNSHLEVVTGSHISDQEGTWLLKFDNTFSYFRSKPLFYRVLCSEV